MDTHRASLPGGERLLSRAECRAIADRIIRATHGGGETGVVIRDNWTGDVRWGRNQITTCGDVRGPSINITRSIHGAANTVTIDMVDDAALTAAVQRAERLLYLEEENPERKLQRRPKEPHDVPTLWFDRTTQLDAAARAATMRTLVQPAEAAGVLAAGYLETSAICRAVITSTGLDLYDSMTYARYTVTVRDATGMASGWAGVDGNDWARVDAVALSAGAVQKCLQSRNPATIEPGRYTAILEPQAVHALVAPIFSELLDRDQTERALLPMPFAGRQRGETLIGEKVIDERITITADPMDPDMGFPPVNVPDPLGELVVYHPVTWFERGILRALAYSRQYAVETLGLDLALPNSGAFHMRVEGETSSIDEMIATTSRGILVTRLSNLQVLDNASILMSGFTRDGVWLIENGKMTKPARNFRFLESVLHALNNVLQLGVPQRVFSPRAPAVVPPLKIRDFNFAGLTTAV